MNLRESWHMGAMRYLGQGLHALQDYYAHLDWGVGSLVATYHMAFDCGGNEMNVFDDIRYDIVKGSDGKYYAYLGSIRYIKTENASKEYLKEFLTAIGR